MSSLPLSSTPLDSLTATRMAQARDNPIDSKELKTTEDTEKVAKKFEALLIHNMLKAMRSTSLGDKPSNERAMYDDMFDQEISKQLTESGGLGIAKSIARQLNTQNGITNNDEPIESKNLNFDEKAIKALSNHPNTLERNGSYSSALDRVSEYQAMLNSNLSTNQFDISNNGSIVARSSASTEGTNHIPQKHSQKQFVDSLMPDAKRTAARLGIEPNIVVAIAALETGWGKHMIKDENGESSHNLFGIKAHSSETPYTVHRTTEFVDDKPVSVQAAFRRYESKSTAVTDFADFLLTNPRYENALNATSDNHTFLRELQRAGYATDPNYANKAINVLKQVDMITRDMPL